MSPAGQHPLKWRNQNLVLEESPETYTVLETPDIKRKFLDIRYADRNEDEALDLYLPEEGDGPFPVIIDLHGGGWYYGVKSSLKVTPVLTGLKRGYAVVSLAYTLSVHAPFPAQIYDVKAAIRFLRAHAKEYHLNPQRIGLWGLSAGAHLAALAGTSANVRELEDLTMGNAQYTSDVQCVVALYGIMDIGKLERQHAEYGVDPNEACSNDRSMGGMLLGKAPCKVPELVRFANPETYITAKAPPFFLQHGLADTVVPFQQSILFADKLEQAIGTEKVTLELCPGINHAESFFRTPENTEKIFAFLDQHLKQ